MPINFAPKVSELQTLELPIGIDKITTSLLLVVGQFTSLAWQHDPINDHHTNREYNQGYIDGMNAASNLVLDVLRQLYTETVAPEYRGPSLATFCKE